jgi:sulfoxide reductase heme-binding subunit YedZ
LLWDFWTDNLTANPIQAIEQRTGLYALTLLLLSLACTPLVTLTGWSEPTARRKALGNYGFIYATLHVATFVAVDYGLDFAAIWADVGTKTYIILGATAFALLLPLAATSFKYWVKRLGKNWRRLHRLVYVISPLIILHFVLSVKGDVFQLQGNLGLPLFYGGIVLILLGLRIPPLKRAIVAWRQRKP